MAKAGNLVTPRRSFNPIFNIPCHSTANKVNNTLRLFYHLQTYNNNAAASVNVTASTKRKDNLHSPLIGKGSTSSRSVRRLITIPPFDSKYQGEEWTSDYLVSLQDLQLQDLIKVENDRRKNAQVLINLLIQKHASFGLSVDARVTTSFTSKCSNCSSPYCRQIDAKFNVWVLKATRDKRKIIGGDPYVIYVRPGDEVDLGSLVQDAIRLNSSVYDTCSESCEKSEGTILYTTGQSQASFDRRWSRLLELKKANL